MQDRKTGIVLMTYGSAGVPGGVFAYLNHIYRGKASPELVKDFEERYRLVGGSPLVSITGQQAALLESRLNQGGEAVFLVKAGMLHSEPFIERSVVELKEAGAEKIRGVILSPQFSSFIMDGYVSALLRATAAAGFSTDAVSVAGSWPAEPRFIQLLAGRVQESLRMLEKKYKVNIPVLFTTHSLPKRVVEKDPSYLGELEATIQHVLAKLGRPALAWYACYQSAGHTPEEWLKPDLTDILSLLKEKDVPAVLIVPIQFLADHLEILYDLDIAAKQQCDERGIDYHRIELPNASPLLIEALASLCRPGSSRE